MSYCKLYDTNTLVIKRTNKLFSIDNFNVLQNDNIICSFTKYSNFIKYNNIKININKYIKMSKKHNIYFNIYYDNLKIVGYSRNNLYRDFFLIFYINDMIYYSVNYNNKSKRNIIIYNKDDVPFFRLKKINKTTYHSTILNNFNNKNEIILSIILSYLIFMI